MKSLYSWRHKLPLMLTVAALAATHQSYAREVTVNGYTEGAVIITVDGKRHTLREAEASPEGVRLISATPSSAVLEYGGQRHRHEFGDEGGFAVIDFPALDDAEEARDAARETLAVTGDEALGREGAINGRPVRMVLQPSVTHIAMSAERADALGINYLRGDRIVRSDEGEEIEIFNVTLEEVVVDGITYRDVPAEISDEHPSQDIFIGYEMLYGEAQQSALE